MSLGVDIYANVYILRDMSNTANTNTATTYTTGDIVIYEDMANYSRYVVVKVTDCQWNPYTLCDTDTCEIITSDMRQRGWRKEIAA